MRLRDRLLPAPRAKGFRQKGYSLWCGSVTKEGDGRYAMFAARWPKTHPFMHGHVAASEVVRASADKPAGPYRFEEVVLPARGTAYWDGRMAHDPFIITSGWEFLLFCVGAPTLYDTVSAPGQGPPTP